MNKYFVRYPGFVQKAVTFSYDDGVVQDRRLASILTAHGMKGTFNLNGSDFTREGRTGLSHPRLSRQDALQVYGKSDHEVAVHGYTHPFLEQLPAGNAAWEILRDREALESMFGCMVRGMAYPMGTYDQNVVTTLRQCGITYARTVKATLDFRLPEDWLCWHPTCHHNYKSLDALCEKFLDMPNRYGALRLFYLWGHSYEFDEHDNWQVIEKFCDTMGGRADIWYATNQQICDYITASRQIRATVNGSVIYNPTATELFLAVGKENVILHPGETLCLPN